MKKKILFIACTIVAIMSSIGTISANDSVTDSYATNSVDDTKDVSASTSSVAESSQDSESNDGNANSNVDDTSKVSLSSEESLESGNSNTLSTDTLTSTVDSGSENSITTINTQNTENKVTINENKETTSNTIDTSTTIKSKDVTKYYKGSTKYTATFLNSQGSILSNQNVKITVNGKTYTVKTNNMGVASLAVNLKPGTYKVTAINPDTGYSLTNTFKILTTISAKNIVKIYKDGKRFYAKFFKSNGKVLSKKTIKFKIKGKTYKVKTNINGIARLSLKSIKKGTYKIISHNADGLTRTNTIKVLATSTTKIVTSYYTYITSNTKTIKATLKNGLGYTVGGKYITFKVNGKTYRAKTNAYGVAKIKLGKMKKGLYTVKYKFYKKGAYKASTASNKLLVLNNNKAAFTVKSSTNFIKGQTNYFKVALTASNIPLNKRTVTFNVNGKDYIKTTNSNGIASLSIKLNKGTYIIKYVYNGESKINAKVGSKTIQVNEFVTDGSLVSVNSIIDSASTLKTYYDAKKQLPSTVSCNGYLFTVPEFLYVMTKTLYQINNSNMADIAVMGGVGAAPSPSGDNIDSKQLTKDNYLELAKNTFAFIESNKRAPNYVSTNLGKIIYEEIVDSMSRGLTFYKENNRLANYLTISQGSSPTLTNNKGLNYAETLSASQIAAYLKATTNCQVNNAAIKNIAKSVTNGLTTDYAKAKAIFEYVRDKLSYSFYFNTKYGAVNALNYKKGNCVDHSHLIIAMCRSAGIAARYVHGDCKFTSGSTYGHVWAQVYVNGKWYVADATSSRNSFGNIVNWNTKSFKLHNVYTSLPF